MTCQRRRVSLYLAVVALGAAGMAGAQESKLVEEYLAGRGIKSAVVRPIADDFVARAFPEHTFFGVLFRQYPVAVQCPESQDLKCANLFYVKDGKVDFVATIPDLRYFFLAQIGAAPGEQEAADAAAAWLRFSGELKQDLFYAFSEAEVSRTPREDLTRLRGKVTVSSGGEGFIEVLMTLGNSGTLVDVAERSSLRAGVRPICQATKLLDRDPIVRRMAEQDLLVMGRSAKPYLDHIRATAKPGLQQAIDRIWQRILTQGR